MHDVPSYHIAKEGMLSYLVPCACLQNSRKVILSHWQRETLMLPVVVPLIENKDPQPHIIVGDKAFPLNPLKQSGYCMYYLLSHSEALRLPTQCLCFI
jgi:hypothetical protein